MSKIENVIKIILLLRKNENLNSSEIYKTRYTGEKSKGIYMSTKKGWS
ncbi:hypothetical protein QJL30_10215 [Clostridioides difficile]|uniref:Uncharacterized protein n=1 Tax=Clostridioides difficile TaxID=1496 RepID=A0A386JBX5_CLODI|nr:hypothetical protein [Clostridioides difficile]AYD68670.1 hypothetical protein pHSJD-312_00049 [Clostridioides difficile]MDI2882303.1 hypothetical protein [Clostridioides difficile]MDI3004314.1 hypothetical protein [Clostridioides difficile]HBG7285322.1 hypothetical protein [Clostridioides difficile]